MSGQTKEKQLSPLPMDDVLRRMLSTPPQKKSPIQDRRDRKATSSHGEGKGRELHQEKQQER